MPKRKRTKIFGGPYRESRWLHGLTGGNRFGGARKGTYRGGTYRSHTPRVRHSKTARKKY